jgi:hypothetical protein
MILKLQKLSDELQQLGKNTTNYQNNLFLQQNQDKALFY